MYYPRQQRASHQYLETQLMSADPLQLVILTYDVAIAACRSQQQARALQAVGELQIALNHEEGGQLAADLLSLYLYCTELIRQQQFEETDYLLSELRQTWVELRQQIQGQVTPQEKLALSKAA
jgi:flagellin-specific chaperone FliS